MSGLSLVIVIFPLQVFGWAHCQARLKFHSVVYRGEPHPDSYEFCFFAQSRKTLHVINWYERLPTKLCYKYLCLGFTKTPPDPHFEILYHVSNRSVGRQCYRNRKNGRAMHIAFKVVKVCKWLSKDSLIHPLTYSLLLVSFVSLLSRKAGLSIQKLRVLWHQLALDAAIPLLF